MIKIKNIKKRYEVGESLSSIAKSMNITTFKLNKIIKENNIELKIRNKKISFSEDQLNFFLEMYNSGKSLREVAEYAQVDKKVIKKNFLENGIDISKSQRYQKQTKFNINKTIFENIDTEEKAYWLGFLLADGYVSNDTKNEISLTLCEKDKEHVIKFATFMGRGEKDVKFRPRTSSYRFSFNDKKIKLDLFKHGVYNNKSLNCKLNEKIMQNENLKWHYLRGLFDGDGHIGFYGVNRDCFLFSLNSTFEALDYLSNDLFNYIGIIKSPKKTKSKCFDLRYYGKNSSYILDKLYNNSNIFLKRKKDSYIAALRRKLSKSAEILERN